MGVDQSQNKNNLEENHLLQIIQENNYMKMLVILTRVQKHFANFILQSRV